MTLHLGQRFENETVQADDQDFNNCTFVNCSLVYNGGELPVFSDCKLIESVWVLQGPALRTIGFFGGSQNHRGR